MTMRKEETVFCEMCHVSQKKIHSITTNCEHEFCPDCMVRLMFSHVDFCENTVSCPVCNNVITSYECEEEEKEEEEEKKGLVLSQLLFKNLQWKKRKDKRRAMIEKRKANMERRRKENKKIKNIEKIESEIKTRRKVCVADNIIRRINDDVEKNENDAWNMMIMRWREKKMMTTWRENMRKKKMSSLKKKKIGSMK